MVAKVFPRYAPLDPLPDVDLDDRALWLERVIPGAAGEIIVGNGLGVTPTRVQWNQLALPLTGGTVIGNVNLYSGADLRGFSDAGVTEKWSIDGATGDIQTDGAIIVDGALSANNSFTVTRDSAGAVRFLTAAGIRVVGVDTVARNVGLLNGTDMTVYSDDGVTTRTQIDGATGQVTINGGALLIRLVDAVTNLLYATTGSLQLRNKIDFVMYRDSAAATPVFTIDGQNGQFRVAGTVPTIVKTANLGTTGTAVVNWGNDFCCNATLTAAGTGLAAGALATLTFNVARSSGSLHSAVIGGQSLAATNLNPYVGTRTAGSIEIAVNAAPSAAAYTFMIFMGGMA